MTTSLYVSMKATIADPLLLPARLSSYENKKMGWNWVVIPAPDSPTKTQKNQHQ
jgi:hypothetical protein